MGSGWIHHIMRCWLIAAHFLLSVSCTKSTPNPVDAAPSADAIRDSAEPFEPDGLRGTFLVMHDGRIHEHVLTNPERVVDVQTIPRAEEEPLGLVATEDGFAVRTHAGRSQWLHVYRRGVGWSSVDLSESPGDRVPVLVRDGYYYAPSTRPRRSLRVELETGLVELYDPLHRVRLLDGLDGRPFAWAPALRRYEYANGTFLPAPPTDAEVETGFDWGVGIGFDPIYSHASSDGSALLYALGDRSTEYPPENDKWFLVRPDSTGIYRLVRSRPNWIRPASDIVGTADDRFLFLYLINPGEFPPRYEVAATNLTLDDYEVLVPASTRWRCPCEIRLGDSTETYRSVAR